MRSLGDLEECGFVFCFVFTFLYSTERYSIKNDGNFISVVTTKLTLFSITARPN